MVTLPEKWRALRKPELHSFTVINMRTFLHKFGFLFIVILLLQGVFGIDVSPANIASSHSSRSGGQDSSRSSGGGSGGRGSSSSGSSGESEMGGGGSSSSSGSSTSSMRERQK